MDDEKMNGAKLEVLESFGRVMKDMVDDVRKDIHTANIYAERHVPPHGLRMLEAFLNRASADVAEWIQEGGPWRSLLFNSVSFILLVALAGVWIFMLLFMSALLAAIVTGFIVSFTLVGSLFAVFLTSLAAIYLGALALAALSISAITVLSICAAAVTAGGVAFLWAVWEGLRRIFGFIQKLLVDKNGTASLSETYHQKAEKVQ